VVRLLDDFGLVLRKLEPVRILMAISSRSTRSSLARADLVQDTYETVRATLVKDGTASLRWTATVGL
jgi:hypothetical protein